MMFWNLFAAGALIAGAAGLGWPLVRALDRGGRLSGGETVTVAFAIGATIFSLAVLAVGLVRLDGVTMGAITVLALIAALPAWWTMPWRDWIACARREWSVADAWTRILWMVVVGIATIALLQGLAPPKDYDSLLYHLTLPLYDVELGRMAFPWERRLLQIGFPQLGGNLSRFLLIVAGDGAAQVIHGAFGVAAAAGAAFVTRRLGFGMQAALLSAILFLVVRSVVWQMATVETDLLIAAYTILALIVYLAWREAGGSGHAVLFGLLIGSAVYAKYIGFPIAIAFAPVILWDFVRRRQRFMEAVLAGAAAILVIAPHATRMVVETGNPVFPLFNNVFNPGSPQWLDETTLLIRGTGMGIIDALMGPWTVFILPIHYYDGMVLGAPYLLAFAPLILLAPRRIGNWGAALTVVFLFYLQWFWLLTQQVRLLTPVLPIVAAAAAAGAALLWEQVRAFPVMKVAFITIASILALNQAMFVGIYAAIRLPPAVGLIDAETYHVHTPLLPPAYFRTCSFIRKNLKPDEPYFSMTGRFHSYYCPQASAVHIYFPDEAKWWLHSDEPPAMSFVEFLRRVEKIKFKYFIISKAIDTRRKTASAAGFLPKPDLVVRHERQKIDLADFRNGRYVADAISGLDAVIEDSFTAVYDGMEVLERLRALASTKR